MWFSKAVRWAFLHCEPYLRRTFKGTTAEMAAAVEGWLTKKTALPGVSAKEKPGYGPPVEKKPKEPTSAISSPALLGVINPLVLAPLGILAALFPGVAARMTIALKRWRAFLVVASINGTLAIIYAFVQFYLLFGLKTFTITPWR